jgi:hypothetical protein
VSSTTTVNRIREDADLAAGLEEQAAKLKERARWIASEIERLESEHASTVEGYEYLQKAASTLRRGEGRVPIELPTLDVPIRRRYPQGYPSFHAIVDVLSQGDALHRSEIVARLTELGFPWAIAIRHEPSAPRWAATERCSRRSAVTSSGFGMPIGPTTR